jgi:hypothetical protein
MKPTVGRKVIALTVLASSTLCGLGQIIVYQDTGGSNLYAGVAGGSEPAAAGDLVTLSGAGNSLTSLTAGFLGIGNSAGATATLSLSFFNPGSPDPVSHLPTVGTQIGSAVTMPNVSVPNGNFDVTFSGLNTTVPNNVIWAITISTLTGTGTLGWTFSGNPTVGSSDATFAYQGIPLSVGGLQPVLDANPTAPTSNLTAEILAVPEPATYSIVFATLCLAVVFARSRILLT